MPHYPIKKKIVRRPAALNHVSTLPGLPPLLQRIYAARRVAEPLELDRSLARLPSPGLLGGMAAMVDHLLDAIEHQRSLLVIGDYDADGATATALAVQGLRALGLERVTYLVPNRFEYGYGLTPEIVALAAERRPEILLTVDNGISSLEGVAEANRRGLRVLVTDHHLPGRLIPEAAAIVNPNQPGDRFPSKSLAGVGVMFYVLLALRARLRELGRFRTPERPEPNLAALLDLVALGTVADVVNLDHVNRILIHQGLQRIRAGQARPGILALLEAAGRTPAQVTATDLGFFAGPRLNAAGRLDDMTLGIECLLSGDHGAARSIAAELNDLNRDRRNIEEQMRQEALARLELDQDSAKQPGLCLFNEDWHEGVIGLVASRIKDRINRPVIAFALSAADAGRVKGSARSIAGVHIRDVLADVATRYPDLLQKFGGHAMAAGLSLDRERLADFTAAFGEEVLRHLEHLDLEASVQSDGVLGEMEFNLEMAELIRQAGPWGQGFPEPVFDGEFEVAGCRIVGERHVKMVLKPRGSGRLVDAIAFGVEKPGEWLGLPWLRAAYRLDVNEFRGERSVQLRIDYMESD